MNVYLCVTEEAYTENTDPSRKCTDCKKTYQMTSKCFLMITTKAEHISKTEKIWITTLATKHQSSFLVHFFSLMYLLPPRSHLKHCKQRTYMGHE